MAAGIIARPRFFPIPSELAELVSSKLRLIRFKGPKCGKRGRSYPLTEGERWVLCQTPEADDCVLLRFE